MRRKRLARLLRKLRTMRKSLPQRDQLVLRIGAAKKEVGRAFGFVKIQIHARDVFVSDPQGQAKSHRTTRRPLSAAKQSHWRRSGGAVDALRAAHADRGRLPLLEERTEHPAHPSSTRASRRRACPHRLPGLLSARHLEESPDDSRAGTDARRSVREACHHPDDRGLDSHARWPVAGSAAPYRTGQRCSGGFGPHPNHPPIPTTTTNQGIPDRSVDPARGRGLAFACGEDLLITFTESEGVSRRNTPEVRRLG